MKKVIYFFYKLLNFLLIEGRNLCGKSKKQTSVSEVTNGVQNHVENSGQQDDEGKPYEGPSLPLYSSSVLEAATDGFANKNKLGQGGFGPVHKVYSSFKTNTDFALRWTWTDANPT